MTMEPVENKACSSCLNPSLKNTKLLKSTKTNKVLCERCLYAINMQMGTIPFGTIKCDGCGSCGGFTVLYKDNKGSFSADYSFAGTDGYGYIVYILKRTSDAWRSGCLIDKAFCKNCRASMPAWKLSFNKFVVVSYEKSAHLTKD